MNDSKINLDIARPLTTDPNKRAGTTNYLGDGLPENYDLDVDNLAEADSDNENKNVPEQQENNVENQNNNMESNNQNRPRPTFNKIMTQKITDIIDNVKTFPEGNLELQPSQKAFRSQVPK